MAILISLIVFYVLLSISLMKVFEKAGKAGWQGLVPGLNFVVWCDIIGRSRWHAAWLLFPIVNIFIYAGMAVDMVRSFGQYSFWHSVVAVIFTPLIFFYLGYSKKEQYLGPTLQLEKEYQAEIDLARERNEKRKLQKLIKNNPYKKGQVREWTEAIIFAVFAAAFIRMFLIEAYKIPTSSMEDTLLVGDFLFVSKAHYGIRTPRTVAMIPLLHNTIPVIGGESYLREPSLPMRRLPALESIDRNEPFVFNFPEGDSIYVTPNRNYSVYDLRRIGGPETLALFLRDKPQLRRAIERKDIRVRPVDKKDHYIKRCIALPGDKLEIRDRQVYINGEPAENPENLQFINVVRIDGVPPNRDKLMEWGVSREDIQVEPQAPNVWYCALTQNQLEKIKSFQGVTVEPLEMPKNPDHLFPHDPRHFPNWSIDNYGPVTIPAKGATVELRPNNIALYWRIIGNYEGNTLEEKNGEFFINGEAATSYTFQQDYYWGMGDNRHNSEDSRVWGFVPADHVVGKPLFIWLSIGENGIRWNRLFRSASK